MHSLLSGPLIRLTLVGSHQAVLSLPQVYAALAADEVESFPALRPHQRHPWHALLCQIGAIACLRAGRDDPPEDATAWAEMLAALTPDFPDGEPWSLVAPPDKPAFLQPVVGPLDALNRLSTPDELDMLVTARNHDLKAARMAPAMPDDWLFALVALQTSEGFLGAGNFGASRMNGGFANRPGVGVAPPGGVGAHVMRDIRRLIQLRDVMLDRAEGYDEDGPALLWLTPWDGTTSLPRNGLHPYYVEICRRVRLVEEGGVLAARAGNSKVARIAMAKEEAGNTGDPWTPIARDESGVKALTVDSRGFDYRRLAGIVFRDGFDPAPLQEFGNDEDGKGWTLLCRALTRGQGKTEGYHERRIAIPVGAVTRMKRGEFDRFGGISQQRIKEAAAVRGALRYALMTLFQNGPSRPDFEPRDPSSARHAEPVLARFQALVDADFFERLFEEAVLDDSEERRIVRRRWLEKDLLGRARDIMRIAETGSPMSTVRRHRALVRADSALNRGFYRAEDLKDYFRDTADDRRRAP